MSTIFTDFEPITPHDVNQAPAHQAIYVGGAGNLVVDVERIVDAAPVGTSNKQYVEVTLSGVAAGSLLPISVYRVKTTSTATLITACRY